MRVCTKHQCCVCARNSARIPAGPGRAGMSLGVDSCVSLFNVWAAFIPRESPITLFPNGNVSRYPPLCVTRPHSSLLYSTSILFLFCFPLYPPATITQHYLLLSPSLSFSLSSILYFFSFRLFVFFLFFLFYILSTRSRKYQRIVCVYLVCNGIFSQ